MLAAENGALPGGKVGGIGDVIRDLPVALTARNWSVTVLTPSYGMFSDLPAAEAVAHVDVPFGGETLSVDLSRIPGEQPGISHLVLEHARFSPQGPGNVYCDDPAAEPFSTDATKFAFFCAAAAACVKEGILTPDVIHLHDWHAAMFLALRAFDPLYEELQSIRTVYTIHNLALQGIRPLTGNASSFESWFPGLSYHHDKIVDPRYHDCVNPMALAIRLADHVNTVSPTYALEILEADDPAQGFHGGEGLELDLQQAAREDRLTGILNGCDYSRVKKRGKKPSWKTLRETMKASIEYWISLTEHVRSSHFLALSKIKTRLTRKPKTLLVSIGRLTPQKMGLFLHPTRQSATALEAILDTLSPGELFVMLGNGDPDLCSSLTRIANQRSNFVFLDGYVNKLPDMLYAAGDLFLMPSTFEPCGISQMFAMREGQPCVVHSVGGLKDTIRHGQNGFAFDGSTPVVQAENFVDAVRDALSLRASDEAAWKGVCDAARSERFSWDSSAKQYEQVLYADHNA